MESGDAVNEKLGNMMSSLKGLTDPKNWTPGKICGLITSVVILTLFITLTVYCGVYAYNNPDPANAWVIKGVDSPSISKAAALAKAADESVTVLEGYPLDMHKIFVAWATWGFWQNLVLLCVFIAATVVGAWAPSVFKIVGSLTGLGWLLGTIAWLVFGAIWRYSVGGSVAAGDMLAREDGKTDAEWKDALEASAQKNGYQLASGKFLAIIFGLIGGLIFLILVACAVAGCLMCFCGWDKDSINQYSMMKQEDKEGEQEQEQIEIDHYEEQNDQLGLNDSNKQATAAQ